MRKRDLLTELATVTAERDRAHGLAETRRLTIADQARRIDALNKERAKLDNSCQSLRLKLDQAQEALRVETARANAADGRAERYAGALDRETQRADLAEDQRDWLLARHVKGEPLRDPRGRFVPYPEAS